jgi:hypothetical protein
MASYSCAQFIVSRAFLVALRPETTYSVDENGVPPVENPKMDLHHSYSR